MNTITDLVIPQDILKLEDIPAIQKLILAFDRQYPKATNETIAHYIGISKRQLYKHRSKLKKVNCSSPSDNEKVNCSSPSDNEKMNCSSPSGDGVVLKTSPPDEINPYEWSWNFINDIKTVDEYKSKENKINKILSKKGVFTYDQLMTLIWMVDGKEKELKLK
jgi:hypothetical protein